MKSEVNRMELREIAKNVKQGNIAPVYLLYGTEEYLMDEVAGLIEKTVIEEANRDFNYSVYDLRETPIQVVLQDAETFPFMGERRMVRATNALFLTGAKTTGAVEHDLDALLNYMENPPDYSVLLLEVDQEKLDERKKVVKSLKKAAVTTECAPLKEAALADWIQRRSRRLQVEIEPDALQLLISMVGSNLRQLDQELEKMALYTGKGERITLAVVETLVTRELEQDIFRLIDQIARLKIEEAVRIYYDLQQLNKSNSSNKDNGEPLKIFTLLARQFRILLQIKTLQPRGYSSQQMASMLGVHPYAAKLATEQAKGFSEQALKQILNRLAEEDYRIKTGQIDKELALELFIMGMKDIIKAP
ncbi:DNA polymerase III subunit delta [Aneurinibacillus tyrosinisolvens]|uniref:DNA polymerase III subunit delta n=1 Tax=Aneurinibacillus tyrosinisolvens TaxID=1443435 RepID=UPI00069B3245|nr:DNA polymerase III subunit delta [Aneurinibacillus tyrosinisolvens]